MKRLVGLLSLSVAALVATSPQTASAIGWHRRCGGCSDTCMTYAPAGCAPVVCLDTGPVKQMHVVLVPQNVTERRMVATCEYREEQRTRVVTGYKMVQVPEQRVRVVTVPVSRTETKTIEYTVQVPVQSEQQKRYTIKVPVWREEQETYTVKAPVMKEVPEQYCVQVPVLREVPFNYTVNVPYPVTSVVNRTVANVVPVVKTRTMSYCQPVTISRTVRVDRGHWENRIEHVGAMGPVQAPGKGPVQGPMQAPGKGGEKQVAVAGPGPAQVVCRQVWVPNVVQEEISEVVPQQRTAEVQYMVYEQHYSTVPYECVCIEYRPEVRTGIKKEVVYQLEQRTRPRTMVEYVSETRTRPKKVLTFQEEERVETYPVVTYQAEKRTKEVSYTVCVPEQQTETYTVTRCEQVPEHRVENFTVCVPVPAIREVEVQVCRMVPQVVAMNVCVCPGATMAAPVNGKAMPTQAPPAKGPPPAPAKGLQASVQNPPACCGG
jgi:hypothetical protein